MPTYREVISDLISDLKAVNLDDSFSFKHLTNKLQNSAQSFLKTDSEYRTVLKTYNLYSPIKCVPMIEVPLTDCGCDVYCKKVMRSKFKIPKTYESKYGNLLKVLTINFGKEYTKIDPFTYKDYKNRRYGKNFLFWILDDYIFIPDSEVEEVSVLGAFKNLNEILQLNTNDKVCLSILDSEFNFPEYIINLAKKDVFNELATGKQINEDDSPDLNSNTK